MTASIPWQALQVVCEGTSIIDTHQLELETSAEAHQFMQAYGYDLHEPSHREQVWKFYVEAVRFIERTLEFSLPHVLREPDASMDFKSLLLIASGVQDEPLVKYQKEACAILRVMHTIAHLRNDLRLKYLPKIRRQTVERIQAHVHQDIHEGQTQLFIGFEKDRIPLIHFEKKEGKNKDSVLLKLLQKAELVAQEVYDHIGVRFVTRTKVEALLLVKYLLDHHLISVANVMSARCRNTLVDVEGMKLAIGDQAIEGVDIESIEQNVKIPDIQMRSSNPFSSKSYHSLQFTSRPLIRIPVLRKGGIRAEISFFFPMEVQILDEASYKATLDGPADHRIYKQKQLEAARQRVLRGLC